MYFTGEKMNYLKIDYGWEDIIEQSTSGNKLKLLPLAENSGRRGMTIFSL